jgi:Glycosyl transferases group 1
MTIYYFCPDVREKSAGIRIIYRHVSVLAGHHFPATIMHTKNGFQLNDVPRVPVCYLSKFQGFVEGDIIVIPEVCHQLMRRLKEIPIRRIVMSLSWDLVFNRRAGFFDYKLLGIERVLTHSPLVADFLTWSMKLPVHLFHWGINPRHYHANKEKQREIVYIQRKQDRMDALQCALYARDPRYLEQLRWTALHGMSEPDYATVIRRATIFVNLSRAEALPCSLLEAMRCGTLVAGYSSIGGQQDLIGSGPHQNAIVVETMDYPALARQLEPVLQAMLQNDLSKYDPIIKNAQQTSELYSLEVEEASILTLWKELLNGINA